MRKYALILAIIVVALTLALVPRTYSADLQALIDATPAGGTLALPDLSNYTGNFVISKSISLVGSGGPAKATIVTPNADPAIQILPGTRDVRIDGLKVTTTPAWTTVHDIVRIGDQGPAQDTIEEAPTNITLNNLDISGQPTQEVQRGVSANGAFVAITNCRITEIHARGYDTQAIGIWNGPGPFKITDNHLEASGENFMSGGAWPTIPDLTITGIEFRRNRVVKPLSWRGVWAVKNLFELKNARNVIVDGNVFDGNWTDAQAGRAIVFTPRPSDSGNGAVVENVTFSNNIVRNVGSGMLISGRDDLSSGFLDTRTKGVRVTNNVFEVDGPRFGSNGVFLTIINGTKDVTVENNTAIQTGNIITTDYAPSTGFTYRNNITRHNQYGIMGSGASPGNSTIAAYFPGSLITGNVIAKEVDAPWNADLIYPGGNFFPANLSAVGFVDLAGGNYRLASWSLYKGAGANGSDPGCDIDALNAALNGGDPGPTPTPTPTPSPSPSPSPSASPTPSTDGTKGSTITDNDGGVWTLGPNQETLRNSVHMSAGYGSVYKWLTARVYVRGQDSNWYQWSSGGWANVGVTEPGTTPSPTPTPTVTPSPSPIPSPSPSPTPAPTPVSCLPTSWPTSMEGQNAKMSERRAEGCYPVRRTKAGMEYSNR